MLHKATFIHYGVGTSLTDAAATPPTIGSSDSSTGADAGSPRNSHESSTEKNGSMAYTSSNGEHSDAGRALVFFQSCCS